MNISTCREPTLVHTNVHVGANRYLYKLQNPLPNLHICNCKIASYITLFILFYSQIAIKAMPFQIPLLQIWNIKKKHWCKDSHTHCDWKYIPIKSIKVFLVFFFSFLQALKKLLYAIFWSENNKKFQPEIFYFNL